MAETFGKTDKGSIQFQATGNCIHACKFTSGYPGLLTSISVYIKVYMAQKAKCAIYNASLVLLTNGVTEEKSVAGDGWMTFNFSTSPEVAGATVYWLVVWFEETEYLYREDGSSNQYFLKNVAYNSFPASLGAVSYDDYELSIYATWIHVPIELDYMEYANDAAAQAAYISSSNPAAWDESDDCSSLTGWTVHELFGGAVSQVTFDSKSCFKCQCDFSEGASEAGVEKDFGAFANPHTIEFSLYHDVLGTRGDADGVRLIWEDDSYWFFLYFSTDGVEYYDGASYNLIDADAVKQDTWQTWRVVVDGTNFDIYLYEPDSGVWTKIGSGTKGGDSTTSGKWQFRQYGFAHDTITYIDFIKEEDAKCPPDLSCYSESTTKQQGSYSLKGLGLATGSLNETLTRTVDPTIDLSGKNRIKLQIRASRTGSNIKIGIHDSGGTTTEHTVNIISADTWQTESWDISSVADANKDAIDQIIITIVNADADNAFYIDDMYSFFTPWIPQVIMVT